MHAKVCLGTDARNQKGHHDDFDLFNQEHATEFGTTDVRRVWGKSRMRATYTPDACNPFNPHG